MFSYMNIIVSICNEQYAFLENFRPVQFNAISSFFVCEIFYKFRLINISPCFLVREKRSEPYPPFFTCGASSFSINFIEQFHNCQFASVYLLVESETWGASAVASAYTKSSS